VPFPLFRSVLAIAALSLSGAAVAEQPKLVLGRFESVLKLMDQGQCEKAREMVFPNSKMADGEEVALADLGDCYLNSAAKIQDPDAAQRARETGAGLILRAADYGIRDAQASAVKLYLDGKVFYTDPYEAGKWYLLWQNNRSQMQLGQVEFNPALAKQLNGYSADVWTEAKARAAAWKQLTSKSE